MTFHQEDETRIERGAAAMEAISPGATKMLRGMLRSIAPDLAEIVIAFAYGEVYSRTALPPRMRQLLTVASLASLGNAEPQLRFHIDAALNTGSSAREVLEVLYATAMFAGFPAALNAVAVAREVFKERGIHPEPPDSPEPAASRRERGLATLEATNGPEGEAALLALGETAPALADFIRDFCYGEVFSRPVLDHRTRSLVLVAAGVARGTMWHQVKVHMRAALRTGATESEIVETMIHLAVYAGFPAALNGIAAARDVFRKVAKEQETAPTNP